MDTEFTPLVLEQPRVRGAVLSGVQKRLISLALLFVLFESIALVISKRYEVLLHLPTWMYFAIPFASSYGGRCIAYMVIGEPFRYLFSKVVPHSSGAGEDTEPRHTEGFMAGPDILMTCPICAGAWAGLVITFLLCFVWHVGVVTLFVFSFAGAGWLITRGNEMIEWKGRYYREMVGLYNRQNREAKGNNDNN